MQELGHFPILASLFAGILTFISPCILPLIPVYITLVTGLSVEQLKEKRHITSILLSSISFILGFTTVFVILGLSVTFLGQFFLNHLNTIKYIGGSIIIFFALQMLGLFKIPFFYKQFSWLDKIKRTSNYFTIFFIGCAFAISWTPCVDPILASILILASTSGTLLKGATLLLVYSLGLGIPFLLTALFINKFIFIFNSLKKHYNLIEKISATLLIFVGILVITGGFSKITIFVTKLFN
jgi:cytochrome c-type biogenesis protein